MASKMPGRLSLFDWTALLILAPLVVGGMVATAVGALPAFRGPRGIRPRRSLKSLRGAIVGRNKSAVASVLGPPRTAMVRDTIPPGPPTGRPLFFQADTWYYALDARDRSAMAIQFMGDVAQGVEFFQSGIE